MSLDLHDPDTHTLLPPGIDIPRMLNSHRRIRRMQAADMFVLEPRARADKHFVQRPIV